MEITEKFDAIDCRQDDKARRVLNVAPDMAANITAEELEAGVTLERLATLNVPTFRYSTQVTIHGRLPDFNPSARPGGYRSLFLNQNGSAGVRYAAIDAGKKDLIARACQATKGRWVAHQTSQGLEISQTFIVSDESKRAEAKAQTIAALRSIPVGIFFGTAYGCVLAYGAGYAVVAVIGAIPEPEVMNLIRFFTGFETMEQVTAMEQQRQKEREAYYADLHAKNEVFEKEQAAERTAKMDALRPQLVPVTDAPSEGEVYVETGGMFLRVKMERARGRLYYTILERSFRESYDSRKLAKTGFPWMKALAAGRVFKVADAAVAA